MSDTRTNAGVDNVSVFRKMNTWEITAKRQITILSAGNLATTQAVFSLLNERTKAVEERTSSMLEAVTMFQIAIMVGDTLKETIQKNAQGSQHNESAFNATMIVGGQIDTGEPTLFLIYSEGNFIEVSEDTPFFQIGETKYGKPILVRAYDPDMSFEDAIKLLMLSFDSTIKANLSVGLPLDLHVYPRDSLRTGFQTRITADNAYYRNISGSWGSALKKAFYDLPGYTILLD